MSELKLNIGCGSVAPEDWINIDNSGNARLSKFPLLKEVLFKFGILPKRLYDIPWLQNVKILDVRKGLPHPAGSVRYIYASHFLKHLTRAEASAFLQECYRVLCAGGVIRIIVPDLFQLAKEYIESYDKECNGLYCDEFLNNLHVYEKFGESRWINIIRFLQNKNIHKWMYDYRTLSCLLKEKGFENIQKKEYLSSKIRDIELLDRRERFEKSICIEAIKRLKHFEV